MDVKDDNAQENKLAVEISNVIAQSLAQYHSIYDYDRNDLVLKAIEQGDTANYYPYKESVKELIISYSNIFTYDDRWKMTDFLDKLLVKNSDFIEKYMYWLEKLAKLTAKYNDIVDYVKHGINFPLHQGLIIFSATDDTEDKVIQHFGGSEWKRVVNFLIGTSNYTQTGYRQGESFVTLTRDNIPQHRHSLNYNTDSPKDTWKTNGTGTHNFNKEQTPGTSYDTKKVYPEISPLSWTVDEKGGEETCRRYVEPHLNIPYYKDVFIWECVNPMQKLREASFDEDLESATLSFNQIPSMASMESRATTNVKKIGELASRPLTNFSSLSATLSYDDIMLLVSDELEQISDLQRYDSKNMKLSDLASIGSRFIFNEILHVEKRYLFREIYKYLLSDIQDRIYLLLKKIATLTGDTTVVKYKANPGQYIFLYRKSGDGIDNNTDYLKSKYVIPENYRLVQVASCFLRGTSTLTQETVDLYKKYTGKDKPKELTTSGGIDNVELKPKNFPKHLHWSSLLNPLDSIRVKEASSNKGSLGTAITKVDPISGGIKYSHSSGTGNYKFTVRSYGTTGIISHNNMPAYTTLFTYMVIK